MGKKIKDIGVGLLGLAGVVGTVVIAAALLFGATAFSLWVLKWTPIAFKIAFAVSILFFVPRHYFLRHEVLRPSGS